MSGIKWVNRPTNPGLPGQCELWGAGVIQENLHIKQKLKVVVNW